MRRIQTFGLLADIRDRVYATGQETVSWTDLEAFAEPMKIKNLADFLTDWVEENMMWIEFIYDNNLPDRKITAVQFGASK